MTLLGKTAIRFADEWISLASLRWLLHKDLPMGLVLLRMLIKRLDRVTWLSLVDFELYLLILKRNVTPSVLLVDRVEGLGSFLIKEGEGLTVLRLLERVEARKLASVLFNYLADARVQFHVFSYELILFTLFLQDWPKLMPNFLCILNPASDGRLPSTICDVSNFLHRAPMIGVFDER